MMTVAEALTGNEFDNLGYQLKQKIDKVCKGYGVVHTDTIDKMFVAACGDKDLSSIHSYIEVKGLLDLFVHTIKLCEGEK